METALAEVLEEVRESGPLSASEVASNLGIQTSAARQRLRRLEHDGLIESDTYQRRARVYLPVEGEPCTI